MMWFHTTPEFRALNVGLCVDEGLANPTEAFTVFYGERTPRWIKVTGIKRRGERRRGGDGRGRARGGGVRGEGRGGEE